MGDGSFADITELAGLTGLRSASVRPGDFDRDEIADLLLLTQGGELRLYRGLEGGAFTEVAEAGFGLQGAADAEWIDYDRDGWVDLRVETLTGEPVLFHNAEGLLEKIELGIEAPGMDVPVTAPLVAPAAALEEAPSVGGRVPEATGGTVGGPGRSDRG